MKICRESRLDQGDDPPCYACAEKQHIWQFFARFSASQGAGGWACLSRWIMEYFKRHYSVSKVQKYDYFFHGVMLNAGFPGIVLHFNRRLQIKQLWQDRDAISPPFTHRIINISIIGLSQFYSKKNSFQNCNPENCRLCYSSSLMSDQMVLYLTESIAFRQFSLVV